MRSKFAALFMVICLGSSFFLSAQPDNLKERFLERKPIIDEMKDAGMVGENNGGFLVFRVDAPGREQREIVNAENADRRIVYRRIAQKHGTNVEVVGQRRAAQIARNAAPGHWLQDAKGRWYRKR